MKKIAYLFSIASVISCHFLYAGTYSHMRNVAHWTGYYMGANVGYNWSTNNIIQAVGLAGSTSVRNPDLNPYFATTLTGGARSNPQGVIGGFQITYNYEQAYKYLYGLEADFDLLQQKNDVYIVDRQINLRGIPNTIATKFTLTKTLSYLGSVRLRTGYMLTPKWLAYGTGGFAYGFGNLKGGFASEFLGDPFLAGITMTKTGAIRFLPGWTIGGGAEWMFKPYWVGRIEALYSDVGSIKKTAYATEYSSEPQPNTPYSNAIIKITVPFQVFVLRAAMSYRFA